MNQSNQTDKVTKPAFHPMTQEQLEENCTKSIDAYRNMMGPDNIMSLMNFSYVSCDASKKELVMSFPVAKWQMNPIQSFHGGLIATSFDISFGFLVRNLTLNNFISTVNLSVNYLRPGNLGDEVIFVSKATFQGRTIIHVSGEAFANDKLIATSTGTFMLRQ